MARKAKPHVHGRDHEHGGADTTLIHYEDVGGSGAGTGGAAYATAENNVSGVDGGDTPYTLLFDDPDGFLASDPTVFDLDSGYLRILQPGGYLVVATAYMNMVGAPDGNVADIVELVGVDAASHVIDSVTGFAIPVSAFVTTPLPGAGGTTPAMQQIAFFNLAAGYSYGSIATLPMRIRWKLDWSLTASFHNLLFSLAVMKFS